MGLIFGTSLRSKRAQMKIQQMSFMLIALFLFFIMVGLFFVRIQLAGLETDVNSIERNQAISSIEVLANMPEFNCWSRESMCIDEDKIRVLSGNASSIYDGFWPVSSIEVYKITPKPEKVIQCPGADCNYYNVFENLQEQSRKFSSFVSLCTRVRERTFTYDKCEIAKLVVGMRIRE